MRQMVLDRSMKLETRYGGDLLRGKRKTARPISTKYAMHTTLRSDEAKGQLSLLLPKNARFIRHLVGSLATQYGVRVYELSVNSNHIHLLTRAMSREGFKSFLRVLAGMIAMKLTGAKKGNSLLKRFWASRPWSRIVSGWGRAFAIARNYVLQNQLEADGIIAYTLRNGLQSRGGLSVKRLRTIRCGLAGS